MNKTVLITGASRGIGRATAIKLAREGFNIVVHYHQQKQAAEDTAEVVQFVGKTARLIQFDIADRGACKVALEADIHAHGAYYGVVLNAGITRDNAFPGLTGQDWDSVISTNLDGFYNVLHPVIMPMIRRRAPGRIVAVSSVSGMIGNRGQVNYSASKAGLIGAVKALAVELGKRQITVNCVAPGLIDTEILDERVPVEDILKMVPVGRSGTPEEIADAIAFLMNENAGYITRQVLAVNGGLC